MDARGKEELGPEYTWAGLELLGDEGRIEPKTKFGDLFDAATHTLSMVPFAVFQIPSIVSGIFLTRNNFKDEDNQ